MRACNYEVGVYSDRVVVDVLARRNLMCSRRVTSTSIVVLGSYSIHRSKRGGVFRHLGCVKSGISLSSHVVILANYFTSLLARSFFAGCPFIDVITGPGDCHLLPSLLGQLRGKRGRLLIPVVSGSRLCRSVLPVECVRSGAATTVGMVGKYGRHYSCYVRPVAQNGRRYEDMRSVLGRTGSVTDDKCQRLALMNRLVSGCG